MLKRILTALILFTCSSQILAQEPEALREMPLERLLEIEVVSASKVPEKLIEAPATMMVIGEDEIEERGYETLEDALRDLPGFDLVHVNGTWPTIWAQRGLYGDENKRTLLLIDGIVENNILEGSVLGGPQYSLTNVKSIEVIWGPASALYGANAFSGIINIITKKGGEINGFKYEKGYGTFNTGFDKFLFGMEKNGVDLSLSGSLFNTDGPVFRERHPRYSNSYVDNAYSLVSRVGYKHFTLGFSRFDRPMGEGQFSNSPSYYGLPPYGHGDGEGAAGGMAQTDLYGEKPSLWHSVTQTAFLKGDFGITDSLGVNAKVYHRMSEIADDSYEYDYIGGGVFSRDPYQHRSYHLGSDLDLRFSISDNQDIVLGGQYEYSDVERGYRGAEVFGSSATFIDKVLLGDGDRKFDIYQNLAVYGQYRLRTELPGSASFIAGLRRDYNSKYGETFNPRAGVVLTPSESLTIKGLVGTAYRAPNSFELFTRTNVRKANPDLVPEKAKTAELGFILRLAESLLFEANFFYNRFADIIVSNVETGELIPGSDPAEYYKQNKNIGDATVEGFEWKLNSQIGRKLKAFANFSHQRASLDDGTRTYDVPNIATLKGNIGITFYLKDILSVYLAENIVGGRSTAPTNPDRKIGGYAVTNLAVSTSKFFDNRISALLAVNNLFDTAYYDPGIRSANGAYYGTRHLQPGMNGFLKLRFHFD